MRSVIAKFAVIVASALSSASLPVSAALPYSQPFNTDTTSLAETLLVYGTTAHPFVNAVVTSGQLHITSGGADGRLDFGAFIGDIQITVDASILGLPGSVNAALLVGDNGFVFHPGFSGGAFRIDGPGGHGNVDMGFTPSVAALNRVSVTINASTGATVITIVDGIDATKVYMESFLDGNYSSGVTLIGLSVGGAGQAVFDNLFVTSVPEPQIWVTFGAGLCVLGALARRRKIASVS